MVRGVFVAALVLFRCLSLAWGSCDLSLQADIYANGQWSGQLKNWFNADPFYVFLHLNISQSRLDRLLITPAVKLAPPESGLSGHKLCLNLQLHLILEKPLNTMTLWVGGSEFVEWSYKMFYASVLFNLNFFPPPLRMTRTEISAKYHPQPWWAGVTVETFHDTGKSQLSLELGYKEKAIEFKFATASDFMGLTSATCDITWRPSPIVLTVQTLIGPHGLRSAAFDFTFQPKPIMVGCSIKTSSASMPTFTFKIGYLTDLISLTLETLFLGATTFVGVRGEVNIHIMN